MGRLVAICGPTASGKSAAAIALAERLGGEVISCDSVAVYRGFDVGAAKPTAADRARVPHHLLDVVDPEERFSAARFVELADRAIAGVVARGRVPIVAGGSGLYLRALLDGLFPSPAPEPEIRARLQADAARDGWPALHARLAAVDPEAARRIAPTDPVRIERALEVWEQTGEPLSAQQVRHRAQAEPRHVALAVVVDPPPADLERRIAARTEALLAGGLVEETRALVARHGRGLPPLRSLGYKEALDHLEGRIPAGALGEAIRVATRRFAKRQRTWFARQPGPRIPDAGRLPFEAIEPFFGGSRDR